MLGTACRAGATAVAPTTVWVSATSGTGGGRELPATSADGRYAVFVGRSTASQGVSLADRRAGTIGRHTTMTSNDSGSLGGKPLNEPDRRLSPAARRRVSERTSLSAEFGSATAAGATQRDG